MHFETVLTSTVVVYICTVPHSIFTTASSSSSRKDAPSDSAHVPYSCNHNSQCLPMYGISRCVNHRCECDENFYPVYNSTTETTYCHRCSLFQESCAITQCCQKSHAAMCVNNICVCRPGMEEECLGRYTPTLGIQLANTLSLSFAFVFLAITFVAVLRKTLFRCDSMSRVNSNSSLNEFIKQKMQNRPPCYDDIEKDRKVPINCSQPPPEYSSLHFGRADASRGVTNPTFFISDDVEMHNAAPPPNYSTFTTVTSVIVQQTTSSTTADPPPTDRNDEIILTRPIFSGRCVRLA